MSFNNDLGVINDIISNVPTIIPLGWPGTYWLQRIRNMRIHDVIENTNVYDNNKIRQIQYLINELENEYNNNIKLINILRQHIQELLKESQRDATDLSVLKENIKEKESKENIKEKIINKENKILELEEPVALIRALKFLQELFNKRDEIKQTFVTMFKTLPVNQNFIDLDYD